jgi:hypothetical protein
MRKTATPGALGRTQPLIHVMHPGEPENERKERRKRASVVTVDAGEVRARRRFRELSVTPRCPGRSHRAATEESPPGARARVNQADSRVGSPQSAIHFFRSSLNA